MRDMTDELVLVGYAVTKVFERIRDYGVGEYQKQKTAVSSYKIR